MQPKNVNFDTFVTNYQQWSTCKIHGILDNHVDSKSGFFLRITNPSIIGVIGKSVHRVKANKYYNTQRICSAPLRS